MIKPETLGMLNVAKNNPVITLDTDTPNHSFIEFDDELYLIANKINGDNAYMEDQVIPAGEYLRGFRVADWVGQKLVVDLKHVTGTAPAVDDVLVVSDGKLATGTAEGVYFTVTDTGVTLTGPAIKVQVCVE
jgi:hypothetical protein